MKNCWSNRRQFFPPSQASRNLAGKREFNKGYPELRVLRSKASQPEDVGFPLSEQAALLRRHLREHRPEMVALVTSMPEQELNASQWLADNRAAWGIESVLHQALDVSHLDDLCRVRKPNSMWIMGMFRRFSHSLSIHWRSQHPKPHHKTTTDFFSAMNAEHHRYAIRCINSCSPSFKTHS